jgi:hypothetical protein
MTGCFIRRARARGAYASTSMLCCLQNEVMSSRVLKGWTSIWLIAGNMRGFDAISSSRCLTPKFETPPIFYYHCQRRRRGSSCSRDGASACESPSLRRVQCRTIQVLGIRTTSPSAIASSTAFQDANLAALPP